MGSKVVSGEPDEIFIFLNFIKTLHLTRRVAPRMVGLYTHVGTRTKQVFK